MKQVNLINRFSLISLILLFILSCSCSTVSIPPKRPESVPKSAVWAGGLDGGAWILCKPHENEQNRFHCSIWDDNGSLWSIGEYVLGRKRGSQLEIATKSIFNPMSPDSFSCYDGVVLDLTNGLLLMPDGEVDYPFEPGWGKRESFTNGISLGEGYEYDERAG